MSHYFETGFSVRKPMWHGLGNVLDEYPDTWPEARKLAGLEWEPELRPVIEVRCVDCSHVLDKDDISVRVCGNCLSTNWDIGTVENENRVIRNDSGLHLGSVSDRFSLVTHAEMGELLEALIESDGAVKFETAGSLREGRQVWALAYLDEPELIAGDDSPTLPYLAVLNSHDGTGSVKVVNTSVRVVCANTARAADLEGERTGRQFVFNHVGKVSERLEEAKLAIRGTRQAHAEWIEMANRLASHRLPAGAVEQFVFLTIPEPTEDVISTRVRNNIDADRATLRALLDGPQNDAHRGTVLGLVEGGIEYLDHGRRFQNRNTLMNRTMLRPEPLKHRVMVNALEVAGAKL